MLYAQSVVYIYSHGAINPAIQSSADAHTQIIYSRHDDVTWHCLCKLKLTLIGQSNSQREGNMDHNIPLLI